jgi:hypothetical protein
VASYQAVSWDGAVTQVGTDAAKCPLVCLLAMAASIVVSIRALVLRVAVAVMNWWDQNIHLPAVTSLRPAWTQQLPLLAVIWIVNRTPTSSNGMGIQQNNWMCLMRFTVLSLQSPTA